MAIPKFEENVNIISQLPNYPGSEGGLTPAEFREKFDEAASLIKEYLNNVLTPELDSLVDVESLLNKVLDATLSMPDKAAQAKAVGDALEKLLPKTGGTVTGALTVPDPTQPGHAANMGYVTGYVDSKRMEFQVTITPEGWTGNGPYTQTVSLEGILESDNPHVGLVPNDSVDIALAQEEAWGLVSRGVTGNGSITFTCYEEKPGVALTIQIEVNR